MTGVTFIARRVAGELVLSSEHDAWGWYPIPPALQLPLATLVPEQLEACTDPVGDR